MATYRKIYNNDELQIASGYLVYHIKMYVETFYRLENTTWKDELILNVIKESHLIHARALYKFFSGDAPRRDDVIAEDYFHDCPQIFTPLTDPSLKDVSNCIGSWFVHITIVPSPKITSDQKYETSKIRNLLYPSMKRFIDVVPDTRFTQDLKNEYVYRIAKLESSSAPLNYVLDSISFSSDLFD